MSFPRVPPRPRRYRYPVPISVVALAALVALPAPPVAAAPDPGADPAAAHAGRAQSLDALNEQLNGARWRLDQARRRARAAGLAAAAARAELAEVRARLRARASVIYRRAGTPPLLAGWGIPGITAVDELGRRRTYARAAVEPDARLLDALRTARDRALAEVREAERAAAALDRRVTELAAARARLLGAVLAARRAAEPRPEEGAGPVGPPRSPWSGPPGSTPADPPTTAPPTTAPPTTAPPTTGPPNGPPAGPPTSGPAPPPTTGPTPPTTRPPAPPPTTRPPSAPPVHPGATTAVAFARAQLGKPYRFAAAGPDAYDCSGLTMAAWAAAGVRMPHYSGAQARLFPKVTWAQLQPGDIVVFYPDYHHVGIYIGGGQMIHAPHTGAVVSVATAWRETFQFGVRPR